MNHRHLRADRYRLITDIRRVFGPAASAFRNARTKEDAAKREQVIFERFYTLFSHFSPLCSYFREDEISHIARAESQLLEQLLKQIRSTLDHVAIHFWDPITGERRRILNHYLREPESSGTTGDFREWIDTIDRIYEGLTYGNDANRSTFVQSLAQASIKKGEPINLLMFTEESQNSFQLLEDLHLLEYPSRAMARLFAATGASDELKTLRTGKQDFNRIRELLSNSPKELPPACLSFGQELLNLTGNEELAEPERLWPILAGLYLWHESGYSLFPYLLSLFPIPFPTELDQTSEGIYFALSGHIARGLSGTKAPPATSAVHEMQGAIDSFVLLAECVTEALQTLSVSLNELLYAHYSELHFYKHELGNVLNNLSSWFGELHSSSTCDRLSGYIARTLMFISDYRAAATGGGGIEMMRVHHGDSRIDRRWRWPELINDISYALFGPDTDDATLHRFVWHLGDGVAVDFASVRHGTCNMSQLLELPLPDVSYVAMRAMLSNLIRNAKECSMSAVVDIAFPDSQRVRIAVVDSGKAYEPASNDGLGLPQREGLGLKVVREFIKNLNARDSDAHADFSTPNYGESIDKEFVLTFPLIKKGTSLR